MIVSVALNPSVDRLAVVDRIAVGRIHRPLAVTAVAGGKGLNAARSAKLLGADVVAAGIFGGHAGRWVVEELAREGMEVVGFWCASETRSSLSVYAQDGGTLTEFYEPGPLLAIPEWNKFAAMVIGAVRGKSWVTISGSLPRGIPASAIGDLVEECRAAGVRVAVDLRGEALVAAFSGQPDLCKVNLAEALEALNDAVAVDAEPVLGTKEVLVDEEVPAIRWDEITRVANTLRKAAGSAVAVVTCGHRGAVMSIGDGGDRGERGDGAWIGEPGSEGPYSVGSGDAFLGAMAFEMERSGDWIEAFRLGLGAGAANSIIPGAGRFDPSDARRMAAAEVTRVSALNW